VALKLITRFAPNSNTYSSGSFNEWSLIMQLPVTTTWTPMTDEIVTALHNRYADWIENLTEIRERMAELRKAVAAGWKPDDQSQSNLTRLNASDEWLAAKNMDLARTVLVCAEYEARCYMPGDRANELFLAGISLAADKLRKIPSPDEMAKFAQDMREGRIPMPGAAPSDNSFKPRLGPQLLGRKRYQ
jgi:hypothetical protein